MSGSRRQTITPAAVPDNSCTIGAGGSDHFAVTVTDAHDITLATAALYGDPLTPGTGNGVACCFRFEVAGVVDGRRYYRLVIGGRRVEQRRGAPAALAHLVRAVSRRSRAYSNLS